MKTPLHIPDTPKSCWSETISDISDTNKEIVVERIRVLSGTLSRVMGRLAEYPRNNETGFKLLNDLAESKEEIAELSEALKAAHKGIKEA